jgi:hypothetical protein
VIATGFGQQRRRRGRGGLLDPGPGPAPIPGGRPPESEPPGDLLDVPSFLRDQ